MLTRTSLTALTALCYIAQQGENAPPADAKNLAKVLHTSPLYLAKILQILARRGVLRSLRGRGGGFLLAAPAHKISLYRVVEMFEPLADWTRCFLNGGTCPEKETCAVHETWSVLRRQYMALLQQTTVADIAAHENPFHVNRTLPTPPQSPVPMHRGKHTAANKPILSTKENTP